MLNRKVCVVCKSNYEKEIKKLKGDVDGMSSLIDCQMAEIAILNERLNEKGKSVGSFEMMILKHVPRYNRSKDILAKIREESFELQNALKFGDHDSIVDESLDLITVCMNAINEQEKAGVDIEFAIGLHQKKLLDRDWEADKVISFKIVE